MENVAVVSAEEHERVIENLRNTEWPKLTTIYGEDPEVLATSQRLWIACRVVDLTLAGDIVVAEDEDIHTALSRAIVETAISDKIDTGWRGRVTAAPAGDPFDSVTVSVDGKTAYHLTNIFPVGAQDGTDQ